MVKNKLIFSMLIAIAVVFISVHAYSQQGLKEDHIKVASGTVNRVDMEGDVIAVQTDQGLVVFHVNVESAMFRYAHHISILEIMPRDPVTVQYDNSSGRNIIIKLIDHKEGKV